MTRTQPTDPHQPPAAAARGADVARAGRGRWARVEELSEHPEARLAGELDHDLVGLLAATLRESGIHEPLHVTPAGVVVDGRHRLHAARKAGLARVPVRVVDPPDPVFYMVEAALARRQLDESARACIAVQYTTYHADIQHGKQTRQANLGGVDVAALPHRAAGRTRERVAELARVSPRLIQDAAYLHQHDREAFTRLLQGTGKVTTEATRIRRARKDAGLDTPPLPEGVFDVVYADPPWQSANPNSAWSPEAHYPTMPLPEICTLPIPAASDAVLFLWAVAGQLEDALAVIHAWDFTYHGQIVWVKDGPIGRGIWVRYQHEPLLIATRGNWPPPTPSRRVPSVITAPRGRHSQKPAQFHELIEHMYPGATRRLELFARAARPGWTIWGNQAPTTTEDEAAA